MVTLFVGMELVDAVSSHVVVSGPESELPLGVCGRLLEQIEVFLDLRFQPVLGDCSLDPSDGLIVTTIPIAARRVELGELIVQELINVLHFVWPLYLP